MRILVICQYYYPEPFRISDICEELVRQGDEVTVLTGIPNYPEGKIYPGYDNGDKTEEIINGVHVIRNYTIPRKKGSLYRLLNYYSYAFSSCLKVLFNKVKTTDGKDFDIVFVNQLSPVMMAYAGILYSWKHKKKLVMYCLDLWPESLIAGGIKKDSIVYQIFKTISRHIYRSCDHIMVTSYSFIDHISKEFGINKKRISYLPQYAEDVFLLDPINNDKNTTNLMFAGNIGKLQSIETIIKAADILKNNNNILFHIVGGGSDLERIKKIVLSKKLNNIILYGRKPIEEMPSLYNIADAMLITLANDQLLSYTLPGKMQSYMAAGKPIIGAANGEIKKVIEKSKCGFCGVAENETELVKNIIRFHNCKSKKFYGENSRNYYNENFKKKVFFENLRKIFDLYIK